MANRQRGVGGYGQGTVTGWGIFARTRDLPNAAKSRLQTTELQLWDRAVVDGVEYVCTDPSQLGSVWTPVPAEGLVLRWDDLRFPASQINPAGLAAPPDRDGDSGLLLFSGIRQETVAIIGQMPHSWAEGTEIHPHVHWIQRAPGVVVWELDYVIANNQENAPASFPAAYTTVQATEPEFPYVSGDLMQITAFPGIDMTGKRDSCVLFMRVHRRGANAADTYSGDVEFVEFDIHYQRDSLGSAVEYPGAS